MYWSSLTALNLSLRVRRATCQRSHLSDAHRSQLWPWYRGPRSVYSQRIRFRYSCPMERCDWTGRLLWCLHHHCIWSHAPFLGWEEVDSYGMLSFSVRWTHCIIAALSYIHGDWRLAVGDLRLKSRSSRWSRSFLYISVEAHTCKTQNPYSGKLFLHYVPRLILSNDCWSASYKQTASSRIPF